MTKKGEGERKISGKKEGCSRWVVKVVPAGRKWSQKKNAWER